MTDKMTGSVKTSSNRLTAMRSISMKDVKKFQDLDTSKYAIKEKPKKIKRSIFDAGLPFQK